MILRSRHTVRNVLVLRSVDLEMLRQLARQGTKLGKARIAAPLIMTPEYIEASRDVLPLEFIEIHQCQVTLFGPDHFATLSVADAHVRLQCERELKAILIWMRQALLAAAGREKLFAAMETEVGERLMRTLRGLTWLRGERAAKPADAVIADVERIDGRPLLAVRDAAGIAGTRGWEQFRALYEDVEALGRMVNGWQTSTLGSGRQG